LEIRLSYLPTFVSTSYFGEDEVSASALDCYDKIIMLQILYANYL